MGDLNLSKAVKKHTYKHTRKWEGVFDCRHGREALLEFNGCEIPIFHRTEFYNKESTSPMEHAARYSGR